MVRSSKPSFVVQNISNKTIAALGMRVKQNTKVDLFNVIVGLTEDRIAKAMASPNGELYKHISIFKTLVLKNSNLVLIDSAEEQTTRKHNLVGLSGEVTANKGSLDKTNFKSVSLNRVGDRMHKLEMMSMRAAMSGDLILTLAGETDGYITDGYVLRGSLNSATSQSEYVTVELLGASNLLHVWAALDLTVSIAASYADPQIADPTVSAKTMKNGRSVVKIDYDVDAGSTKVYEPNDFMDVTIKVSAGDTMLGYSVASVTKRITIV